MTFDRKLERFDVFMAKVMDVIGTLFIPIKPP